MRQEPILVREKRYNFFPQRFVHQGVERRVVRVESKWAVAQGRRQRAGHYFRVRCYNGAVYRLFHDVQLNAWFVERGWPWSEWLRNVWQGKAVLTWERI